MMRNADIEHGIEYIYDLEKEVAFLEDTITCIELEMIGLGNESRIEYHAPKKEECNFDYPLIGMKACGIIGSICGVIWGIKNGHGSAGLDVIITVPIGIVVAGLVGVLIGCVLDCFISKVVYAKIHKDINEEYERKTNNAKQEYEKAVRDEKTRVRMEQMRKAALAEDVAELKNSLEKHKNELNALYESMDILPEYRGFVQMGYMYQLMRIGIGPNLKGVDGLYDRVRKELRADSIENKLDSIRSAIIDSNNRLYGALSEINSRTSDMIAAINRETEQIGRSQKSIENVFGLLDGHMDKISNSAAIAAYNTERSRKLAEYAEFRYRHRNGL